MKDITRNGVNESTKAGRGAGDATDRALLIPSDPRLSHVTPCLTSASESDHTLSPAKETASGALVASLQPASHPLFAVTHHISITLYRSQPSKSL